MVDTGKQYSLKQVTFEGQTWARDAIATVDHKDILTTD